MTNAVINVCVGLHLLMWLGAMLLVCRAGWTAMQSRWGGRLGAMLLVYAGLAGQPCKAEGTAGWYDKAYCT